MPSTLLYLYVSSTPHVGREPRIDSCEPALTSKIVLDVQGQRLMGMTENILSLRKPLPKLLSQGDESRLSSSRRMHQILVCQATLIT